MAIDQQLWYWPYELHSNNRLNAVSERRAFAGCLIRATDGFGCIHPWPELGDAPLDQQLKCIQNGSATPLVKQALRCAALDGAARACGEPLYQKTESLPRNHWLWKAGDNLQSLIDGGFDIVKLKIGPDKFPTGLLTEFSQAEITIRLDANESLDFDHLVNWWHSLSSSVQSRIEFIEDPIPWSPEKWARLQSIGIPIAADRDVTQRSGGANWVVIKPATEPIKDFDTDQVVFTSYMDHPIGQLWAASQAQQYYRKKTTQTCGLLTHHCFDVNAFSERLVIEDTMLLPPQGTGLGFDDLLEKLPWQRLI